MLETSKKNWNLLVWDYEAYAELVQEEMSFSMFIIIHWNIGRVSHLTWLCPILPTLDLIIQLNKVRYFLCCKVSTPCAPLLLEFQELRIFCVSLEWCETLPHPEQSYFPKRKYRNNPSLWPGKPVLHTWKITNPVEGPNSLIILTAGKKPNFRFLP